MFSAMKIFGSFLGMDDKELKIREAINELNAMNDRELNELGLSRANIEHAVRYGRKEPEVPRAI